MSAFEVVQKIVNFSAIAIFVLLVACINFMNLSTARSANRAKEVGVRKVLGSPRRQLVFQFITESTLVTFFATVIAFLSAWLLLPVFNGIAGKELAITWHLLIWILPALLAIVIMVGLMAGFYPAFFLSAFQPIDVLRGKLSRGFKGGGFRSFLVVFQFTVSILLISGTIVIYNQLQYMQHKEVGFDREQVLIIKNMRVVGRPMTFEQEIRQIPGVIDATLSDFLPTGVDRWAQFLGTGKTGLQSEEWPVDEHYLPTMKMSLVEGRNFSNEMATDSLGMIVNETAARMLNYSSDPIGKLIYSGWSDKPFHIIGVVKDFNFSSMRDNVAPLVMKRISYSFRDRDFDAMYVTEQRMGKISVIFTVFCMIIACLGLFGLATFAAEQRNREISIRKVLGADASALAFLLSGSFLKLIVIASCIGMPISWLVMHKWLEGFAYRSNIAWWHLLFAPFLVLIIALFTVSYQAMKAALANPIKNLRKD